MKKLLQKLNKEIGEISRDIKQSEWVYQENYKKEYAKIRRKYKQKEYDLRMGLYEGKSELLIPHHPNDKGDLSLRSSHLNSLGVNIKKSNYPVSNLSPSTNYQIECTVINHGDLAVPLANVEFFISPKFKPHDFEMEITGTGRFLSTTIRGKVIKGSVDLLDHIRILCEDHIIHTRINGIIIHPPTGPTQTSYRAEEGEEVTFYVGISKTTANTLLMEGQRIVEADPQPPLAQRAFRFRITDVFRITGRGTVVTGKVEQGTLRAGEKVNVFKGDSGRGNILHISTSKLERFNRSVSTITPNMEVGILLGNFRGTINRGDILVKSSRETFNEKIDPIPEPEKVNEYEFLGRTSISVPAMDSTIASFPFRTSGVKDRNEYIFTCRVFATTPVDMPDNFDTLNPKMEKRVGAKKLPWKF